MPLRRLPGPPDLDRVVAVLAGPPPGRARPGWVPDRRAGGATVLDLLDPDPHAASGTDPGSDPRPAPREARADPAADPAAGPTPDLAPEPSRSSTSDPTPRLDETAQLDADLRAARRPRVLTVPEQLRSGRLAVSSAAVLSLLALVVALACAFAVRVLWADRSAGAALEPAPGISATVSVQRAAGAGPGETTGPGAAPTAPTGTASTQVVVHVVGQVKRPGLVRLQPGARVADAIAAAGGAGPRADLSLLNLARLVVDGEQVHVPRPGEVPMGAGAGGAAGSAGSGGAAGGGGSAGGGGGLVNLNTADLAALDTLPGVGPVLAQRILDWRAEHGRFTSVEELGEVSGIGEKLYAQIRPKVTV